MEVIIEQEKLDLIRKLILSDKRFAGNEDLLEDFVNETCKRSLLIIKSVKNEASLEVYLRKIVTTAIITVLKDSGRVRRTKEGFISTEETSLEDVISVPDNKYSNVKISYDVVDLQEGPEELVIKKETLQSLLDAVSIVHNNDPAKQYMQLYQLRYVKGLKQKQIAQELNLSQSEVSKRLLELMEEVKLHLNNA